MNSNQNKSIKFASGTILLLLALVFLWLSGFGPGYKLAFYLLYVLSIFAMAYAFHSKEHVQAYGITSIGLIPFSFVLFAASITFIGPREYAADPVGANSMTQFFELMTYPLRYLPVALPAFPCWVMALCEEKWPNWLHVILGMATTFILMVNGILGMSLVYSPDLFEFLFG